MRVRIFLFFIYRCTGTSLHLAHTGVHIHTGVHNHACGHRFTGTSLHLTHTGVHIHACMYTDTPVVCSVHLLPTFLQTFYTRTLVSLTYDMIALQAHKLW